MSVAGVICGRNGNACHARAIAEQGARVGKTRYSARGPARSNVAAPIEHELRFSAIRRRSK